MGYTDLGDFFTLSGYIEHGQYGYFSILGIFMEAASALLILRLAWSICCYDWIVQLGKYSFAIYLVHINIVPIVNKFLGGNAFGEIASPFCTYAISFLLIWCACILLKNEDDSPYKVFARCKNGMRIVQMKVSIIVPVYNVENYLDECVNSLINQTMKEIQIILVDDGSTDKSGKIADRYAALDSRILALHKINGGQSSARNLGLKYASGEYVLYVDSDDYIIPETCQVLYTKAREQDADIIHGDILNEAEN